MNDKDLVLCLIIEDFLASIDDLETAGTKEECDELIRAFGYDKKAPISMILTGFYLGFGKGMELDAKMSAYKDQKEKN